MKEAKELAKAIKLMSKQIKLVKNFKRIKIPVKKKG